MARSPCGRMSSGKAPATPRAHTNLGEAYHQQKQLDRAIEQYQISLSLNPYYSLDAYSNLASIFVDRGEYDRAIEYFSQLLYVNANDYLVYANRGQRLCFKRLACRGYQGLRHCTGACTVGCPLVLPSRRSLLEGARPCFSCRGFPKRLPPGRPGFLQQAVSGGKKRECRRMMRYFPASAGVHILIVLFLLVFTSKAFRREQIRVAVADDSLRLP